MRREILISASTRESRVALLEDGRVVEFQFDRPDQGRSVGDICLGKVEAVLPGIQASFVDIGAEKAGFLHVSDVPLDDEELEEVEDLNGNGRAQGRGGKGDKSDKGGRGGRSGRGRGGKAKDGGDVPGGFCGQRGRGQEARRPAGPGTQAGSKVSSDPAAPEQR